MNKLENKYINNSLGELHALFKVWRSREYAGTSQFVGRYENALQQYFGIAHAAALNNGTHAIEVAARALGLKPGDAIMMPAYAPVMSIIPLLHYGLVPIFVDCEPSVFNLSLEDVKRKRTPKTKAIMVVPMWGYPISMAPLRAYCKKEGLFVIEDASHCHGSKLGNRFVGILSDISTFSTQERKMVATGEGGFALTKDNHIYSRVLSIRDFGKIQAGDKKYPDNVGEYGYYDGSNFRISGASAAIGIAQLRKLEQKIAARTANAHAILNGIKAEDRYKELSNVNNTRNNYYSLVLQLTNLDARNLGNFLAKHDIISDTHRFKIRTLYNMPQFSRYASKCPNTEALLHNIVTVPTHEGLSAKDRSRIIKVLLDFAE